MTISTVDLDRQYIWHPYSSIASTSPLYAVKYASGATLTLEDGTTLIDGMASWWCVIHGYNHPVLNAAIIEQTNAFAHVMFGGLTHQPAATLAKTLVAITPSGLDKVFLSDSGSVSVDVALKMALQYWMAKGIKQKTKFMSLEKGYHGDTLGAMSVCDPETGMHHLFADVLPKHVFVPQPKSGFTQAPNDEEIKHLKTVFEENHKHVAAFILEPIVQGAGGMYFYHPHYLNVIKSLCEQFDVLLIADEIATGFGRSGKLFACEHANISPDIMCVGKSLTGGYLTLAATLCSDKVAETICQGESGVFMHGPTFMANPLACAVANASINLLLQSDWQANIKRIEQHLTKELIPLTDLQNVKEVRVMGAIGVVELHEAVDMNIIVPKFVEQGIWIRPFGKLVYTMPPYCTTNEELAYITKGITAVLKSLVRS